MKKALIVFLKIALFFTGWAILSGIIDIPSDNPAIWRFFAELSPFGIMVVFSVIFLCVEKGSVRRKHYCIGY